MTQYEYAVRETNGDLIRDTTWASVADVIASYHGGNYTGPDKRITGTLLRAVRGSDQWEPCPTDTDPVNHPSHYTWLGGIEVIDITEHMGFCLGNVVKYVLRADHKGQPVQDLEKAAWYLNREIANRKSNPPRKPGGEQ